MFEFEQLNLAEAFLFSYPKFEDERGSFLKIFEDDIFKKSGIDFEMNESYFSFSKKGVIRGMHFQNPPYDHCKIVFCPQGAILDVIVDLRKNSPTFSHYLATELSAANRKAYYIPKGFAHGFKALTDDAVTFYYVSTVYNKDNDTGIRYDSFGFDWDEKSPVISERDLSFLSLKDWAPVF